MHDPCLIPGIRVQSSPLLSLKTLGSTQNRQIQLLINFPDVVVTSQSLPSFGGPVHNPCVKVETFQAKGLMVQRMVNREGPAVTFVVHYKDTTRVTVDPQAIVKTLKLGKGTKTRDDLQAWLASFDQKETAPDLDQKRLEKEGFGPEATKMVI